jgi:MYXO-CTERM domain-containing protein
VGSASFGDTDGDGLDEIIVEVADGYLYDLKQKPDQPGGAGGTGGTPGTGGMPGTGGHGGAPSTGGAGGAGPIDEYPIYGRATCACTTPGPRDGSAPGLAAAAALALSLLRRRSRRR